MRLNRGGKPARVWGLVAGAVVAGLLAATPPAQGRPGQQSPAQEPPEVENVILYIVDLSGSMSENFGSGRTKLDVAKDSFADMASGQSANRSMGLRVYGDQHPSRPPAERQENCETDTRMAVPIDTGNRDAMLQEIEGFEATGDTPIALALQQMVENDIPEGALATVVLFSDGRDECHDADLDGNPDVGPSWGPDPCEVAEQVAGEGVDLRIDRIDTIGFQADEAAREQLGCIAEVTGGTAHNVDTEEDAENLPDILLEAGRDAERLGGEEISGGASADEAPELARIAPGETNRRYVDQIAMNEERWYRATEYGPGEGHTTATVFGLPAEEGITLEVRMEPGPEGQLSSPLVQTRENVAVPSAPSDSVRCSGCHVVGASEPVTLYWVVALRSEDPEVSGTFDLELLLEDPGWGGPPSGCLEGMRCWYEAQIDAAEAQIEELQAQLDSAQDVADVQSEIDALEAERAALTDRLRAIEATEGETTNWLLPALFALLTLGTGGGWLFLARTGRPQPAIADVTADVNAASGPVPSAAGVIGTIDLGSPPADGAAVPSAGGQASGLATADPKEPVTAGSTTDAEQTEPASLAPDVEVPDAPQGADVEMPETPGASVLEVPEALDAGDDVEREV